MIIRFSNLCPLNNIGLQQVRTNSDSALYDVSEREADVIESAAAATALSVTSQPARFVSSLQSARSVGSVSDLEHIRLTDSPHAFSPPAALSPSTLVTSLARRDAQLASTSHSAAHTRTTTAAAAGLAYQSPDGANNGDDADNNGGTVEPVSMDTNNSPPSATYPSPDHVITPAPPPPVPVVVNLPESTLRASNSRLFQRRTLVPMDVSSSSSSSNNGNGNSKMSDNKEKQQQRVSAAAEAAGQHHTPAPASLASHSRPTISVDTSDSSVVRDEPTSPVGEEASTSSTSSAHQSKLATVEVTQSRTNTPPSADRRRIDDSNLLNVGGGDASVRRRVRPSSSDALASDAATWSWLRRHSDSNVPQPNRGLQVSSETQLRSHSTGKKIGKRTAHYTLKQGSARF